MLDTDMLRFLRTGTFYRHKFLKFCSIKFLDKLSPHLF